jgi:voltage-gated potassium channel
VEGWIQSVLGRQKLENQITKLANVSLVDSGIRQKMNLIVIAIQDKKGEMIFNPKADTKFVIGDTVVVMGSAKSVKQLESLMRG